MNDDETRDVVASRISGPKPRMLRLLPSEWRDLTGARRTRRGGGSQPSNRRTGIRLAFIGLFGALLLATAFLSFRAYTLDARVKDLRHQISTLPSESSSVASNPLPSFQLVRTIHLRDEGQSAGEVSFFQYTVPNSRASGPLTTLLYSFQGLQPDSHYSIFAGSCPGQTGSANSLLINGFTTDGTGAGSGWLDNLSLPQMTSSSWLRVYSADNQPVLGFRGSLSAPTQTMLATGEANC